MTEPTPSVLEKGGETEETMRSLKEHNDQENVPTEDDELQVGWDGPDDPANPFNWSTSKKVSQLVFMSVNTFVTPLASSMFAPGIQYVMEDFHSTDQMLGTFVVSIYVLGYMLGPLLIAPLSEIYGRVRLYHACNMVFLLFTVTCAVAQSLPQLIVFRLFAGIAGVCPITIGSGTVADMISVEKRAGILAIWALGPILGPVVGPIAGGFLAESVGWRWVFWVLAIATGVMNIGCLVFYHESYAPVLLRRKTERLRKATGNPNLRSLHGDTKITKEVFINALARPMKLLFRSPIVFLLSLFAAVTYGYLYLMFTTLAPIFKTTYNFSSGLAGLAYLGFGIGCILGLGVIGVVSNRIAASHTARGCFTPESRLPPMLFGCWAIPAGLFWYGWSAQAHTHWIVPILGMGVFAIGLVVVFMASNTYLVDSYLIHAASVTAAATVLRSLIGAVLPLAGPSMYATLGLGWGNSLLAFIALVMCACPVLFWKYGEFLRTHPRFQIAL
ncbi:major facilitator superfamily domain-containing protein [Aspergillus coremiiformis]|uniref:Major facilitator superfamily domain-containing protein n=1 Tax=Aspergillus coremiiformis TaxID=138285 RepID=A0A5N6Z9M0_9EURO|nr:major facilitator superfamily domain-containing protein [Aspergillus coremiiformis]